MEDGFSRDRLFAQTWKKKRKSIATAKVGLGPLSNMDFRIDFHCEKFVCIYIYKKNGRGPSKKKGKTEGKNGVFLFNSIVEAIEMNCRRNIYEQH